MDKSVVASAADCYVIVLLKSKAGGATLLEKLDYVLHKNSFWRRAKVLFKVLNILANNIKISGFNVHRRFLDCVSSFYLLSANINTIRSTFDVDAFFEASIDFLTVYLKKLEWVNKSINKGTVVQLFSIKGEDAERCWE